MSGADAELAPLPVPGYTSQSGQRVLTVTGHKQTEERLLRHLDTLDADPEVDHEWLAQARGYLEAGFMFLNRAVFRPQRIKLPEDTA